MDTLLKSLGFVLYLALLPLFAVTEITIGLFAFLKFVLSIVARIRFVRMKRGKLLPSLNGHRFHLPWSLEKQSSL
jgi:hypothetical protein